MKHAWMIVAALLVGAVTMLEMSDAPQAVAIASR